ncbi:MAG TPA: zinc ribbon domain-containing protein [Blastocatellia bacterium]|nr:zinc ribbon domain-containing protein [Blastocatellia bacterium]
MFCPRCGSQNTDATKYCRQCGLPLAQVSDYVAAGGTGAIHRPPAAPPLPETSEMLALRQQRILTILGVCIAPVVFAILANEVFKFGDISGIPFLLVPIGIVWARFRYKMQLRRLQERQFQEYYAQHHQPMPQQAPTPKLIIQPQTDPSQVGQVGQVAQLAQVDAPKTNPLPDPSPGSVVEDETRKFPEQHG